MPIAQILQSRSRARKTPVPKTDPFALQCVLAQRDQPGEGLRRVPGPVAIRYLLEHDPTFALFQVPVPSIKTIYRILKANDRIVSAAARQHEPMERPAPLRCWQVDFKDVSSVPADPHGKRQHVVETLNIIDMGTSMLLGAHVRPDFSAETAMQALIQTMREHGFPQQITVDRDPRWVGSPAGSDFPAALLRLGHSLGIEIVVCDPHHPQQNGFVERYNRTYQEECLRHERPGDLEQARTATEAFKTHYNSQRPHQGISCGNRPPLVAIPNVPPLPRLPEQVDPDSWLQRLDGLTLVRKVNAHGMVSVDLKAYYISSHLVGHRVALRLDGQQRCLQVSLEEQIIKSLPIKGLVGHVLSFEEFVDHMSHQARSRARLRGWQEPAGTMG